MAVSMLLKLTCLVLACMVVTAPRQAEAAISCGSVASSLGSCIPYMLGRGGLPPSCCTGVRSLNSAAKTTPDRQTTCRCLKSAAAGIRGLNPGLVQGLPGKCGVNLPYKFSTSTDCTKVR